MCVYDIYAYIYIYMYVYTYVCIYIYIYIHIHVHIIYVSLHIVHYESTHSELKRVITLPLNGLQSARRYVVVAFFQVGGVRSQSNVCLHMLSGSSTSAGQTSTPPGVPVYSDICVKTTGKLAYSAGRGVVVRI